MAVNPIAVEKVVRSASANAARIEESNGQAAGAESGQPGGSASGQPASGFDVWTHTVEAMDERASEDASGTDRALAEAVTGDYADSDWAEVTDSMDNQSVELEKQASAAWEQFKALTGSDGSAGGSGSDGTTNEPGPAALALGVVGATFGALTTLEQMISAPLSVIPFPAFPAIRVTDMDVGLPHAHTHPPNLVPPAPPVPFPSTGPIIPIPFLSGATQTLINGMPAARCGDMGLGIWCGGYFPIYEVFFGSSSVWIEGARAGRLLVDLTHHCIFSAPKPSDPPLGPPVGMTITSSPNVLIGGVPMPSLLDLAMGAAVEGLFRGLSRVAKKVKASKAAKAADDIVDDVAARASRNSGGPRPALPRPTRGSYENRLLHIAGGNKIEALKIRRQAREMVDRMIRDGKIEIEHFGDEWTKLVKEDLYLMASTSTGKRTLSRIESGGFKTTIYPPFSQQIVEGTPYNGPSAWANPRRGNFDEAAGVAGPGTETRIYYDPNTSLDLNSPPDVWLNHEFAHAANSAEGMGKAGAAPEVVPQPHMTPEQRSEIPQDDLALAERWTNKEEQNVILNEDIEYRRETGLPGRFGHGDSEGLTKTGHAPGRPKSDSFSGSKTAEFEIDPSLVDWES